MTLAETRAQQHLRAGGGRLVAGGRGWLLAALALLLVACVGLGSARPLWKMSEPSAFTNPRAYVGDVAVAVTIIVFASTLIAFVRRRGHRRPAEDEEPEPNVEPIHLQWWGRVLVALAMLGSVVAAILVLSLVPGGSDDARVSTEPAADGSTAAERASPDSGLPPLHRWVPGAVLLAMLAVSVAAWRHRSRPGEPDVDAEQEDTGELLAAVDLSLEDIDREPDPRLAVIRAYARMERALDLHGLGRRPSETPLEYLARALTSLSVGRASVERLTALFERAKFSRHEIDLSMKAEALAALTELRDELGEAAA